MLKVIFTQSLFLFYLSYLVPLSCHNVSDEVCHGLSWHIVIICPAWKKKKWNQDFWPTQIRSTWSTYFWHIQSLLSTLNAATMNSGTFKLREREVGRAVEGIAKSSCQDYLATEKEAPQMVFRLMIITWFLLPDPMTWAGRNVERRITDAMVKKKLWVQLLVKCWTIEHGQKVVGLW